MIREIHVLAIQTHEDKTSSWWLEKGDEIPGQGDDATTPAPAAWF